MNRSNRPVLGCIADDFTGATDLANNLVRAGMRAVQAIGVPQGPVPDADAVIVALKSRTIPAQQAVAQSLQALEWLVAAGCRQFYFKVCSTFDSTAQGNIGPVAEALVAQLGADSCCVTPAFPTNGRTVYKGHLFVGDVLLSESGMRDHPLTPMTDANLVRVLQAQLREGRVGLVSLESVRSGRMRERMASLQREGCRFAIVDAIDDDDLMAIGAAVSDAPLVVAGSGVAIGLPRNFGFEPNTQASQLPPARGGRAIVSGSCSVATNAQVADFVERGGPSFIVDPMQLAKGEPLVDRVLAWARERVGDRPILVYSSAPPAQVRQVQQQMGASTAGTTVEEALASIARGLVEMGVGQLVVAGGETSGACVQALGVDQLRIGPQIDPGVPWCHAGGNGRELHLALKSGNFGSRDFFTKAFAQLQ